MKKILLTHQRNMSRQDSILIEKDGCLKKVILEGDLTTRSVAPFQYSSPPVTMARTTEASASRTNLWKVGTDVILQ